MAHKGVSQHSAAQQKTPVGATQLAYVIRATLNPESISEPLQKRWGPRLVCNDSAIMEKDLSLDGEQTVLRAERLRQTAEIIGDVASNSYAVNTKNRTRQNRQKIGTRQGDFSPESLKKHLAKLSSEIAVTPVDSAACISNRLPSRYPSCKSEG